MTVLMVMVKPAERGEVVEKFKQLIAFECCLYCPATLTPGLVEMGQVSIFEHRPGEQLSAGNGSRGLLLLSEHHPQYLALFTRCFCNLE